MAYNKKMDKNKRMRRPAQSALFKRKRVCRFTAEGVDQIQPKAGGDAEPSAVQCVHGAPLLLTDLADQRHTHAAYGTGKFQAGVERGQGTFLGGSVMHRAGHAVSGTLGRTSVAMGRL